MKLTDILVILAVGFNTFWLIKETKFLRRKVKDQSEFIKDAKNVVELYRGSVADHEKIVRLLRESAEAEKERAISGIKAEMTKQAGEAIRILWREQETLLDLAIDFIGAPVSFQDMGKYIYSISDDVISKRHLVKVYEKRRKESEEFSYALLKALMESGISRSENKQEDKDVR